MSLTTRSRRLRVAVALVATLGIFGAACGNEGDDDAGGSGPATGSEAAGSEDQFADLERIEEPDPCENAPGVSDAEIKVGTIAIESGPQALSFAPALDGLKARIEKANQEGELGARKITLVTRDDTGDQTRNAEVARDLVEQEDVFGIIEDTSASNGSAQYLNEQGIPVAGWHVGVPAWSTFPNMFTFRQGTADEPDEEYNTRSADLLEELGVTKVALIGGGNQQNASYIDRLNRSISQAGSAEIVYENVAITTEVRDFTAEVQAIKDAGADGVITGMDLVQNAALSDGLAKAGVNTKAVIFPGGYDPRVLGLPGMEGALFGLEFFPFELDQAAFEEFDKWAPESLLRGQVPFVGWLSAEMFIRGLKEAGLNCPTREAFIANLRLVDDYDGAGAFDPVDLSEGFGDEFLCVYYVKVENGAFVPQFDGEEYCGEPLTFE